MPGSLPSTPNVKPVLIVLKYGGSAMGASFGADPLLDDIAERVRAGDDVVLVHGGGPQIDAALRERNIESVRVDGLRITDAATLAVTESVLCGTVNKALVRALTRRGVAAAGISGQDASTLVVRVSRPVGGISLGFVGEIDVVRTALLQALVDAHIVPVVAPLGITADGTQTLNVNADTAAGAIAGALVADVFIVVTDVDRVRRIRDDPASGFTTLTSEQALRYLADGTFDGGMRPKMASALDALARGAKRAVIGGSGSGALGRALAGEGTTVVGE